MSDIDSGIILYMRSANERRRYIETSSLIGWAHTQNDPFNIFPAAIFLKQLNASFTKRSERTAQQLARGISYLVLTSELVCDFLWVCG